MNYLSKLPYCLLLGLLFFVFTFTTALKKNSTKSNKQAGVRSKSSDIIDIDFSQDWRLHEGSGSNRRKDTDDDDGDGDRDNFDDDDDDDDDDMESSGRREFGSGVSEPVGRVTPCLKLLTDVGSKMMVGAYLPRCTNSGDFAPVQCHGSTGDCWCATRHGQKIPGSVRRAPDTPNCSHIDRDMVVPTSTARRPARVTTRHPAHLPPQHMATVKPGKSQPNAPSFPPRVRADFGIHVQAPTTRQYNKIDPYPLPAELDKKGDVTKDIESNDVNFENDPKSYKLIRGSIMNKPGVLAGIIGGAVIGLLCAVLLVMFVIYLLRRKQEQFEEKPNKVPIIGYTNGHDKDLYA